MQAASVFTFPSHKGCPSPGPTVHDFPLLWASHPLSWPLFQDPGGLPRGRLQPDPVEPLCELVEGALPSAELPLTPSAGYPIQDTTCTTAVENGDRPQSLYGWLDRAVLWTASLTHGIWTRTLELRRIARRVSRYPWTPRQCQQRNREGM